MVFAASETVLFAIQAGLRLFSATRRAYVDATRGRELLLPLPRSEGVGFDSAVVWFRTNDIGKGVVARHQRVRFLLDLGTPDDGAKRELVTLYLAFRAQLVDDPSGNAAGGAGERELGALLAVRQWVVDEPGAPRSALQQIAGTIIELAVDYFAATPGAVSDKSPSGRALLSFLRAIDDVDFANTPVRDIAGDLMLGVLDGVVANPDLIAGGDKEQAFVRNITLALATSAKTHLANGDPTQDKLTAGAWLGLIARAMVEGGAQTVLANPARFLGVDGEAETDLVQAVGRTLADLVLGENKPTFRRLLSGDGLRRLAQSALAAVAHNPALLKVENKGLENLLVSLASDLASREDLAGPDLLPDVARLVLEKTAQNLELIWGRRITDPGRNLLLAAVRSTMKELARKPPTGSTWKPSLTKEQFVAIAESVLDMVVDQPEWLLKRADDTGDTLGVAVRAMLEALRGMDENRISGATGVALMRAGLAAVARQIAFVDELPGTGKRALTAVLDAVLAAIFSDQATANARWVLARNSSIQTVVEIALDQLAARGIGAAQVECVRVVTTRLAAGEIQLANYGATLSESLNAA